MNFLARVEGPHVLVSPLARIPVDFDASALDVDDPVIPDAGQGIQPGLPAAILGEGLVRDLDNEQDISRPRPFVRVIVAGEPGDIGSR